MLLNCGAGEDSRVPLDSKIKPVNPKENQLWIFIGRTLVEAETPILWPPDAKNRLIWKNPDAGKDWRQEEKGMTEDEMVGWHHWFNEHEFGQTLGDSGGQGGLAIAVVHEVAKSQKQLGNWMTTTVHPLSHKIRADWSFMRQSTQVRKKKKTTTGASTCLPL